MASTYDTIMQVGKGGVTPNIIKTISDALEARELIKLRVLENSEYTPREAAEEIAAAIGRGGVLLDCDSGKIWLKRGSPFAQSMGDPEDAMIKRKYLNITAEFLTAD
jgi:hypothetical protein